MLDVLALFPFVKTCTPHHAIARYANHFNSKASHWHVEKSFSNKCRRRFWKRIIQFATEPILEPSTAGDADAEDAARAGAAGAAVAAARGAGGAGGAGGGGGGGGGSVAPPPLQAITPLRVGWLEKRGGLNTNFKRRFFVLWPKLLLYYEVLVRSSQSPERANGMAELYKACAKLVSQTQCSSSAYSPGLFWCAIPLWLLAPVWVFCDLDAGDTA